MNILVALDSFKGSLTAAEACAAVAEGVLRARPGASVRSRPMADGGEGTAAVVLANTPDAEWIPARVAGPLPPARVDAGFVWMPEHAAALVELAAASGLTLLAPEERDPLRTTTLGTGQLMRAATARGARSIALTVGGSATVDGGCGMARALGWRFLDEAEVDVPCGGGSLERIRHTMTPSEFADLPEVEVWCDVDNPLLGPRGAAAVFGPQKGADAEGVRRLERGLARLADLWRSELGVDVSGLPGGGAAGGAAAGAAAFFGARLRPGIEAVMEVVDFDRDLAWADLVVTGEGRFDEQSRGGKVVSGVLARAGGRPVALLAGRIEATTEGFVAARAATGPETPLAEAMDRAYPLLANAAEILMQRL